MNRVGREGCMEKVRRGRCIANEERRNEKRENEESFGGVAWFREEQFKEEGQLEESCRK